MILALLIIIPLAGGVLAWASERVGRRLPGWVALAALALDLLLAISLWPLVSSPPAGAGQWAAELRLEWIPRLGASFHLALDGLSFLLVLLTLFLGVIAVLCSWSEIRQRRGFFHFHLLWTLAGIAGVFLALDLFLFSFFWELMLVPMYFLIALWGHENRRYASLKFFIFTQLSGLCMLVAVIGLYLIHGQSTGVYTFDYLDLLGTAMSPAASRWLMLGFLVAFSVKLPMVPFHTWLPDAHTEAPTAGSLILAGLLLKTGAYGLLRFLGPLFPAAVLDFAPVGMALGVAGILYGAFQAFGQDDLKRLIAYTSVSHMGFVALGIFAGTEMALQGVVLQMLCHGISTGALFLIAGALQERLGTRDMAAMGGLWNTMPKMAGAGLIFGLASLGLPGMGNFAAEFLVLLGSFSVSPLAVSVSALGLVAAAAYSLRMVQRVFYGPKPEGPRPADLSPRELAVMAVMTGLIVLAGLYPQPVFTLAERPLKRLVAAISPAPGAASQVRAGEVSGR